MLDGNTYALRRHEDQMERQENAADAFEYDIKDELEELENLSAVNNVLDKVYSEDLRDSIAELINDEALAIQDRIMSQTDCDGYDFSDLAKELIKEHKGSLDVL